VTRSRRLRLVTVGLTCCLVALVVYLCWDMRDYDAQWVEWTTQLHSADPGPTR
jgi:hypothetical protein